MASWKQYHDFFFGDRQMSDHGTLVRDLKKHTVDTTVISRQESDLGASLRIFNLANNSGLIIMFL